MIRIGLFLITNLAIVMMCGLVLNFIGIESNTASGLLILSLFFGFGGSIVSLIMSRWIALRAVRGKLITNPNNPTESWLVNVIRQQAKRVNINMPQIAIYNSTDINAFATGARRNAALIAVSSGLLKNMSQDEVQAVIAHEITHITNGDMVTMSLLQGVMNTFVIFFARIIAYLAAGIFNSNDAEDRKYDNPIVYFAISTALELILGILASLITMWFSRYREFYADAGSAKLVGVSKMIAALKALQNTNIPTEEMGSIKKFCINGRRDRSFSELFMTHPSLEKRIQALQDPEYIKKYRL